MSHNSKVMSNNQNYVIVLRLQKERLQTMILQEETWIQSQRDRVADMHVHVGELEMQISDETDAELRSDLETTLHLYSQRIWREESHLATMEQEFHTIRDSLLHDIWNIDENLGE